MSISVVFIIRNAIKQGYCFWESLLSCLPFADEIIISEGMSNDGTDKYIKEFAKKYCGCVPIHIFYDEWGESYHGEMIAKISQNAINRASENWIYYLQADEIVHEKNIDYIKSITNSKYNSVEFPFYHFIRSWSPSKEGYKSAIRMIRNKRDIFLKGDAWNFEGNIEPVCKAENAIKSVYHFAWVFPKQNDIKDIEHYGLYKNCIEYKEKMQKACVSLKKEKKSYPITDFNDFPELSKRFIGEAEYPLPFEI